LRVIGAMITRGSMAFRSSGEMIKPGRVLLISVPMVGSRFTQ
jgi:hypothetical protein